jgi:hypothetical protein
MNGQPGGRDGYAVAYENKKFEKPQLFDLQADVSEMTDVAIAHPEVVGKLELAAEKARADLGDSLRQRPATNVRPPGRVK